MKITLYSFALCFLIFLHSCKKDQPSMDSSAISSAIDVNSYQTQFAKILAKAVENEPALRSFIKAQSLKQFDKDYDVLYQLVKNERVTSTLTLNDLLLKYSDSESQLAKIGDNVPLLTIFVPVLPNFSAESWDVNSQIPQIAVAKLGDNRVPLYNSKGEETIIEPENIPGFPVLVIKQNERVIVNPSKASTATTSSKRSLAFLNSSKGSFSFSDEAFNGLGQEKSFPGNATIKRVADASTIDPVNIEAYNSGNEWQRDYVYYGITASNPTGKFKNNYSEFLKSFKFIDGAAAHTKIGDQSEDPTARGTILFSNYLSSSFSRWTDGNYEIRINFIVNAKNGTGNERTKMFTARGSDLFNVTYYKSSFLWYKISAITSKEYYPNLELEPWDLQTYSTGWKFLISEVDLSEEVTNTSQSTATYAANFSYEASLGTTVKNGVKFGASASTSEVKTYSVKTTLTSDNLGEATLTFDQPVITSVNNGVYSTREISTGWVTMSIEPKKVF